MTRPLAVGDPAPDLTLTDQHHTSVHLGDLRGGRVIVYFFPKAFTPGCTTEVCDFRDSQVPLAEAGCTLLGVSGDTPERLAEFAEAYQVEHSLLSDPDHAAARQWGAWGPKTVAGVEVEGPWRSTFVVGPDGRLRSVDHQVEADSHVATLQSQLVAPASTAG